MKARSLSGCEDDDDKDEDDDKSSWNAAYTAHSQRDVERCHVRHHYLLRRPFDLETDVDCLVR